MFSKLFISSISTPIARADPNARGEEMSRETFGLSLQYFNHNIYYIKNNDIPVWVPFAKKVEIV